MTNIEVASALKEVQQFWVRWRDNIPHAESDQWEDVIKEAYGIKEKYGKHAVPVWENGNLVSRQEYVVGPLVDWFRYELESRERANTDLTEGQK